MNYHMVVSPLRAGLTKQTDMTELETLELWVTAKEILTKLEEKHNVKNFQVSI